MGIFEAIRKIFRPKKVKHIKLDEKSIREHNTIRALANENAELKGINAKLQSKLGQLRESEKDKEEED